MSSSTATTTPQSTTSTATSSSRDSVDPVVSGLTGISYTNGQWELDEVLSRAQVTEKARRHQPGVQIIFLSEVKSINSQLKRDITSAFHVPEFFWSEAGYEANGFVSYKKSPLSNFEGTSYSTTSRFLIKQIKPVGNEYEYGWEYLSFLSLWYKPDTEASEPTQLLLCFDLSADMQTSIATAFRESDPSAWRTCPFGVYSAVLVPVISRWFNDALWQFRVPIRNIEKSRLEPSDEAGLEATMARRYLAMHELSRHVIHEIETLQISSTTLASLAGQHNRYRRSAKAKARHHDSRASPGDTEDEDDCGCCASEETLSFYHRFLENLSLRAAAFDKRLQNEITLAFNLTAEQNNATSREILKNGQNDGRELTQLVSTATLLFLPGSFISSVFGMNFFEYGDRALGTSDQIYIFVIVTVVVTVVAFAVWRFFVNRSRKLKALKERAILGAPLGGDGGGSMGASTEARVLLGLAAADLEKRLVRGTTFPAITETK